MAHTSEQTQIEHVVTRLSATYPAVPPTRVVEVVQTIHARFDGRPLRDFVPLFVERGARGEIAALDA